MPLASGDSVGLTSILPNVCVHELHQIIADGSGEDLRKFGGGNDLLFCATVDVDFVSAAHFQVMNQIRRLR